MIGECLLFEIIRSADQSTTVQFVTYCCDGSSRIVPILQWLCWNPQTLYENSVRIVQEGESSVSRLADRIL